MTLIPKGTTNMPLHKQFTVMCQHASGKGTVWIDTVDVMADSQGKYPLAFIQELAIKECADAWEADEDDLHCMGVVEGQIDFLFFDDTHFGD